MKEMLLDVEVTFIEKAKHSFNFPITNSIRTSFWLKGSNYSTFSEVQKHTEPIQSMKPYRLKIIVGGRDVVVNMLEKGKEFRLGTFPYEIAFGKIIKVN